MDRKILGRLRLRRIAALAFAMAHCTAVIAADEAQTAGVVSADAFGADSSGRSDSTDAIARAIRAVTDRGGGKVEFGPGSYKVAGTIRITESAVTLEGIKALRISIVLETVARVAYR
jgi:polygalacturonase